MQRAADQILRIALHAEWSIAGWQVSITGYDDEDSVVYRSLAWLGHSEAAPDPRGADHQVPDLLAEFARGLHRRHAASMAASGPDDDQE